MGKSKTGKIILIIVLVLILICGCIGVAIWAINSDFFRKGGDNLKSTTQLAETPKYELIGTYNSIYEGLNNVEEKEDAEHFGTIKWGKFYSANDYKFYYQQKDVLSYAGKTYNSVECYAEDEFDEKKMVQEPYNDKNIIFIKTTEDYNIELKDTGDVNLAFLSLDNSKLICISNSYVKAFDLENGSEIWKIDADKNMYFGSIDETISTDRKKLIVNMYSKDGNDYKYSVSKVINLNEGTDKIIRYSGKVELKGQNLEKTFENQSIDASAYICNDIFLCNSGYDTLSTSDDIYFVVDDNGNIKASVQSPVFATASGMLIRPTSKNSDGDVKWTIFDSKFSAINSFIVGKYENHLNNGNKLSYSRDTQTMMAGDKVYSFIDNGTYQYAFDSKGNILAGFTMDNLSHNSYMFSEYKKVSENEGEEHDYSKDIKCIMNIYTGETLEGYEFESAVGTGSIGDGHKQSQGDIAYIKNTEDKKKYFVDEKFDKIYNIPNNEKVVEWANYENSKYMAYSTGKNEIYVINKENKEITKIKDDNDNLAAKSYVLINGDFIMYCISKDGKEELHAYNMEKKEDNIIFKTKSDDESIYFNAMDARQNNWFYVYREENNGKSVTDLYRLK